MKDQSVEIRQYILKNLSEYRKDIVSMTSKYFHVTRTTVHRHMQRLINEGKVLTTGKTRAVSYCLPGELEKQLKFPLSSTLDEYEIWTEYSHQAFQVLQKNIDDAFHYGFTEILNNAIEHSGGKIVNIKSTIKDKIITLSISDDGIGVFTKISNYLHLDDKRESVLQLSKGKLTTDPQHHTGEGIFFSSRTFDQFDIISNGLHFYRDNIERDWSLMKHDDKCPGTTVIMKMNINSKQNLVDVFKKYQDPETLAFDRTDIIVDLSRYGVETFISRSQAKRILNNLEKFNYITLDFTGVRMVGQGFVDQVFRVYVTKHKDKKIDYINANEDVEFMIKRCLASLR